jgi:hypothetical protein
MAKASSSARTTLARNACVSPAPCACDTSPVVPMRKKPNPQNTKLKKTPPSATPPMYSGPGKCPATAVSTADRIGCVRLASTMGNASVSTRRCHRAGDAGATEGAKEDSIGRKNCEER